MSRRAGADRPPFLPRCKVKETAKVYHALVYVTKVGGSERRGSVSRDDGPMAAGTSFRVDGTGKSFGSLRELVEYWRANQLPNKMYSLRASQGGRRGSTGGPRRNSMTGEVASVGCRCTVVGYSAGGVVRFVGEHHSEGTARVGVELDAPIGKNNGTVGGHQYFVCPPKAGQHL